MHATQHLLHLSLLTTLICNTETIQDREKDFPTKKREFPRKYKDAAKNFTFGAII